MKITDIRIGDRVRDKVSKFPMVVVGTHSDFCLPITSSDKGTVYLDFEGNEGDVWEEDIADIEFCEPRYKLPEWRIDECGCTIVSNVSTKCFAIEYMIDDYGNGRYALFFGINNADTTNITKIGYFHTIEEAKEAAEKHYNEMVSELIEKLTSAHFISEASKS